jgi:hypothetical protein
VPNINDPLFDEPREHPGFRCLRARIGRHAGCERLAQGGGLRTMFRMVDTVDYHDGEQPPAGPEISP